MSHFTMEHHVGVVEVNGIIVNREAADTVENVQIPQSAIVDYFSWIR